jgi:hypothetical protein
MIGVSRTEAAANGFDDERRVRGRPGSVLRRIATLDAESMLQRTRLQALAKVPRRGGPTNHGVPGAQRRDHEPLVAVG